MKCIGKTCATKGQGGVALFVESDSKCKVVESITMAIDNLMECVTVEINVEINVERSKKHID